MTVGWRGQPGTTMPGAPERLLVRERLLDALDGAATRPLTLVTAPAGYGKTTAVAHWCRTRCPLPVAWIPAAELTDYGELAAQIRDDGAAPQVLVVDGLDGAAADRIEALAAIAAEQKALHLIVTSRRPLADRLAALRLTGAVDVLRRRDLRLNADEVGQLVSLHSGSPVRPALAAAVCEHLEGWMAGAVLVALDWDPAATPQDHRTVLEPAYRSAGSLAASLILEGLGVEEREVLGLVACLPEIDGPLCEHLVPHPGVAGLLDALEGRGAPMERGRSDPGLHRFPAVARAVLRTPGRRGSPEEVDLLRRAAEWYGARNLPLLSAACLAELNDWDAMADVILGSLHDLLTQYRLPEMVRFLITEVPAAALQERFMWTIGLASILLTVGEQATALALVATVEPGATPAQLILSNVVRLAAVSIVDDPTPCLEAAERALALCDEVGEDCQYDDLYTTSHTSHWRTQARAGALLAGSYLGAWERVAKLEAPVDPVVAAEMPPSGVTILRGRRATYFAFSGRLTEAAAEVARGQRETPPGDGYAAVHAGVFFNLSLGLVELGRGRPGTAIEHATEAVRYGAERGARNIVAAGLAVAAHGHLDDDRPEEALHLLHDELGGMERQHPPTLAGLATAAEALALLRRGDVRRAHRALDGAAPTSAVSAAAMCIALQVGDHPGARAVLDAWPAEPTVRSRVEADLGRAALAESTGHRQEATRRLGRALATAAPQGLVQPFVRLGVFILRPLRQAAHGAAPTEVAELAGRAIALLDGRTAAVSRLTDRERLVLHHLASGATLPRLAEQLTVSVNTVKTQVRAIYRKLGVSSRAEALAVWATDAQSGGEGSRVERP